MGSSVLQADTAAEKGPASLGCGDLQLPHRAAEEICRTWSLTRAIRLNINTRLPRIFRRRRHRISEQGLTSFADIARPSRITGRCRSPPHPWFAFGNNYPGSEIPAVLARFEQSQKRHTDATAPESGLDPVSHGSASGQSVESLHSAKHFKDRSPFYLRFRSQGCHNFSAELCSQSCNISFQRSIPSGIVTPRSGKETPFPPETPRTAN
jgi:hypothetical protein